MNRLICLYCATEGEIVLNYTIRCHTIYSVVLRGEYVEKWKLKMAWNGVEDARKRYGEHGRPSNWQDTQVEVAHRQAAFNEAFDLSPEDRDRLFALEHDLYLLVVDYLSGHARASLDFAIRAMEKKQEEERMANLRRQLGSDDWNGDGKVQIPNQDPNFWRDRQLKQILGGDLPTRGPLSNGPE